VIRLMIVLLTIFLSSCNSYQILCDVSFEESRCRCRCFDTNTLKQTKKENCTKDWNSYFYGVPDEHPFNFRVNKCEGLAGFRIEEIAKDIIPMINEERAACEDGRQ